MNDIIIKIKIKKVEPINYINLEFTLKRDLMTSQEKYQKVIFSNAGVLYLKGKPGVGKSDIARQIAEQNNLKFFDIRLTQVDSSEVAGIPKTRTVKTTDKNGKEVEVEAMYYALPEWAVQANKQPSLVMFDELNRADKATRDAALQIFNEKRIGWDFQFNNNVYFIAAGNLGEEDGTDVDVLDSALNGRLIHMKFSPTFKEWEDWAKKSKVNDTLINFLRARDSHLYKASANSEEAYASPRSWANFSKFLGNADIETIKVLNQELGAAYVGASAQAFMKWLEEQTVINVNQIIDNFDKVKQIVATSTRSKISELLNDLKTKEFKKFNALELRNVMNFLKTIEKDETVGYINFLMDTQFDGDTPSKNFAFLMKEMPEFKTIIKNVL